jgi:hypothetical protein
METKKAIIYALLAYIFYKMFINKEGFALSTGIITLDDIKAGRATLDPTKQYYRGIRNVTSTTTPAINGGQGCTEYPDVVFKPVPSTNAVCKTWTNATLEDSMYIFDTTAQPGSFHTKIISLPTIKWRAFEDKGAGGFVAQRLYQGRLQCLTTNGKDCLWRGTMSEAESDAIKANATPAPETLVIGGPQWPYVPPATQLGDPAAYSFNTLREAAGLTTAQLSI